MPLPHIPDGVAELIALSGLEVLYHQNTNAFRISVPNSRGHWTIDDPKTFEGWKYAIGKVLDMSNKHDPRSP